MIGSSAPLRVRLLVDFLAIIAAAALLVSGWALAERFQEGNATEKILQRADQRQVEAIRTVLCLARRQTATSRQRTPDEKRQAFAFYDQALREIHAKPCDKEMK